MIGNLAVALATLPCDYPPLRGVLTTSDTAPPPGNDTIREHRWGTSGEPLALGWAAASSLSQNIPVWTTPLTDDTAHLGHWGTDTTGATLSSNG